jgi:hypothetical protein
VLAALVNEGRRRGAADDVDPPAEELEPFGGEINDHRGNRQLGGEPWLDRMTIARCHIDRLTGNLPAHVAGDDGTNRTLCDRAGVSTSTLGKLRKGWRVSDKSLFQLVRAAEQLRQETESNAVVNKRWIQKLQEFLRLVGSQNKLAKLLGVSRPYLGRCWAGKSR